MEAMPEFVKDARGKLNLSQERFGQRLGVNRHTIMRYEQGKPMPERMRLAILRLLDEDRRERRRR